MILGLILIFFFNDTATTEIYTLSYTTLFRSPCSTSRRQAGRRHVFSRLRRRQLHALHTGAGSKDRKSTRLNSSHLVISYAVFCLKKKNRQDIRDYNPTESVNVNALTPPQAGY